MKAYKGFTKDMTCRNFQYEEGKTYEHEGDVKVCKSGFHACEDAIDVLDYYAPGESVYHEVDVEDIVRAEEDIDTKIAARKITIGARLSIAKLIEAGINFRMKKAVLQKDSQTDEISGAASATGDRGAASATGYSGAASATGDRGAASATGDRGAASATGAAGVAVAAGRECKAMGALGCALFLVERKWDEDKRIYAIANVAAVIVDGESIKPDTWYYLKDGKITEV